MLGLRHSGGIEHSGLHCNTTRRQVIHFFCEQGLGDSASVRLAWEVVYGQIRHYADKSSELKYRLHNLVYLTWYVYSWLVLSLIALIGFTGYAAWLALWRGLRMGRTVVGI